MAQQGSLEDDPELSAELGKGRHGNPYKFEREEDIAMADNQFSSTMETLFKGLEQFVTSKTVVGQPVQAGDVTIIPLIDVTCGMGAGAFGEETKKKQSGGGGMSAKMSPSAVLVVQGGVTRLINVKNQDAVTKVIDMAPDLINKFLGGKPPVSEETAEAAKNAAAEYEGSQTENIKIPADQ